MDEEESKRMTARFEELGYDHVRNLASMSGFPHTWQAGVHEWLAAQEREQSGRKKQGEEEKGLRP